MDRHWARLGNEVNVTAATTRAASGDTTTADETSFLTTAAAVAAEGKNRGMARRRVESMDEVVAGIFA